MAKTIILGNEEDIFRSSRDHQTRAALFTVNRHARGSQYLRADWLSRGHKRQTADAEASLPARYRPDRNGSTPPRQARRDRCSRQAAPSWGSPFVYAPPECQYQTGISALCGSTCCQKPVTAGAGGQGTPAKSKTRVRQAAHLHFADRRNPLSDTRRRCTSALGVNNRRWPKCDARIQTKTLSSRRGRHEAGSI